MTICFDVDGCLINKEGKLIEANYQLMYKLAEIHKVYIWSGNGWKYAQEKIENISSLRINEIISGYLNKYGGFIPDVAFDDQEINLGKLNIKV